MFTGIVQALCEVAARTASSTGATLTLNLTGHTAGLATGASVAVNGTCLTVTRVDNDLVSFDVVWQTLHNTNLDQLQAGDRVNVERSFRVGDEVGGHILSGHIATPVVVAHVLDDGAERRMRFEVPAEWFRYLQNRGFVALDGASLTIADIDSRTRQIEVCLIPETIARTTLGLRKVGERVNLEVDAQTQAIVNTVERILEARGLSA